MSEKIHNSSNTKRENYLSWDETFMQMCFLIAQRSKDPNSQVGACIVDQNNVIVSLGYNGFPRGCSDDILPWTRGEEKKYSETKYAYVVHAEANAIFNSNKNVTGCKLYSYLFPCNECAKVIVQTGIAEIIYAEDFYHDKEEWVAARKILETAGIKCRQYKPQENLKDILCSHEKKQKNLNTVDSTLSDVEKQTIPTEQERIEKNEEIINIQNNASSQKTEDKDDDEPSQFIFENIPTN